jgi:hypothetical protein
VNNLTNEQLIEAYKDKAADMSYYNASEGQSWYQETAARQQCQLEFSKIRQELLDRNIEEPNGSWLV